MQCTNFPRPYKTNNRPANCCGVQPATATFPNSTAPAATTTIDIMLPHILPIIKITEIKYDS